ncbi:MAG: ribonuclease P [archaeon]|nr:ribonuclease P [archaeon]MCQ2972224.1 ribonuclease P [archaeon]
MKLKVLPSTLRKNNRYLTVDIKVKGNIDKNELVALVWDGCIRYWGEVETSNFNLWVMKFYEQEKTNEYNSYKSIIRCQRGYEDKVRAAYCCINKFNNKRIAISVIGSSGTIKSSIERYI